MLAKEAIKRWYEKGYTVFPLQIVYEHGKKKVINSFKWREADLNYEKAVSLLRSNHNAIAALTGRKYNLFVVDFDNKNDPEGELESKLAEYGIFFDGKTPMVQTPSGGAHYYFAYPDGIQGSTTREGIVRNLDIRGDGGLIFAPPTLIENKQYRFVVKPNGHLPPVPNSLIRLINDHTGTGIIARDNDDEKYKYVYHAVTHLQKIKLSYDEWIKCGMAISEMGEPGRAYWLILSDNDFYIDTLDEINYKYDNFLKTTEKISIATLFKIAKENDFQYHTEHHTVEEKKPQQTDSVIFTRQQIMDALKYQYDHATEETFSLGYGSIVDDMVRITRGQVSIVTGVPQSGKSNWLDDVLVNLSRDYDWRHVVFSPESQPLNEHIDSLVSKYSGFPVRPGFIGHLPVDSHSTCVDWIANHFYIMDARTVDRKLTNLMDICESIVLQNGADTLILDPWNEITHERPSYMTETEYISWVLGRLRAFALQLNIHIFIIAHPTKLPIGKSGERIYKVGPYDISGSANWWNKCDLMFSVYRDFANDGVEVYIHKVKRARLGKIGHISFRYINPTGQYKAISNSTQTDGGSSYES